MLKNLSAYAIILIATLIYYFDVFKFFIGGDDVIHLVNAPNTATKIIEKFTYFDQYRPIPLSLFGLYHLIPFNTVHYHLFSIILLAFVLLLFFLYLVKILKISRPISITTVLLLTLSHIVYYLVYTLAGIGDLIFLIFFWTTIITYSLYLKSAKSILLLISCLGFLGALFSKEIFIAIPIILTANQLIFDVKKQAKKLLLFWIPTFIYFIIKFTVYSSTDPNYTYNISATRLIENTKHFTLWLVNYQHGWQMGMPMPVDIGYKFAILLNAIIFFYLIYKAFKIDRKITLFIVIWAIAGLVPFLFLQRVLVFYLNITLFAVYTLVAYTLNSLRKKRKGLVIILILSLMSTNLYISNSIKKQWLTYSFVAVASETAENFYNQVVKPTDWENIATLCIDNLSGDSLWAIGGQKGPDIFIQKDIEIFTRTSGDQQSLPAKCSPENPTVLNVQNESRSFYVLNNFSNSLN